MCKKNGKARPVFYGEHRLKLWEKYQIQNVIGNSKPNMSEEEFYSTLYDVLREKKVIDKHFDTLYDLSEKMEVNEELTDAPPIDFTQIFQVQDKRVPGKKQNIPIPVITEFDLKNRPLEYNSKIDYSAIKNKKAAESYKPFYCRYEESFIRADGTRSVLATKTHLMDSNERMLTLANSNIKTLKNFFLKQMYLINERCSIPKNPEKVYYFFDKSRYNNNNQLTKHEVIPLDNSVNNEDYTFGPFDYISDDTSTPNEVVANNIEEALNTDLKSKDIVIIGYGQSGSGKTSTLIQRRTDKGIEKGVLNYYLTQQANYLNEISIECVNLYYDNQGEEIGTYNDFNIKLNYKTEVYDWNEKDMMYYNIKQTKELLKGFLKDDNDYKKKCKISIKRKHYEDADSFIGKVCEKILDLFSSRQISPTPNNHKSSRSHIVVCLTLGTNDNKNKINNKKLLVCDLAGVENEFECENDKEIIKFDRQYELLRKDGFTEKPEDQDKEANVSYKKLFGKNTIGVSNKEGTHNTLYNSIEQKFDDYLNEDGTDKLLNENIGNKTKILSEFNKSVGNLYHKKYYDMLNSQEPEPETEPEGEPKPKSKTPIEGFKKLNNTKKNKNKGKGKGKGISGNRRRGTLKINPRVKSTGGKDMQVGGGNTRIEIMKKFYDSIDTEIDNVKDSIDTKMFSKIKQKLESIKDSIDNLMKVLPDIENKKYDKNFDYPGHMNKIYENYNECLILIESNSNNDKIIEKIKKHLQLISKPILPNNDFEDITQINIQLNARINKIRRDCGIRREEGFMINRSLYELNKGMSIISKERVNPKNSILPIYIEKIITPTCRNNNLDNYLYDKYYSESEYNNNSDEEWVKNLKKYGVLLSICKNHFGIEMDKFKLYTLLVYNTSFFDAKGQKINLSSKESRSNLYYPVSTPENTGKKNNTPSPPYINLNILKYYTRINLSDLEHTRKVIVQTLAYIKRYPFYRVQELKDIDTSNITNKEKLQQILGETEKLIELVERNNSTTFIGTFENTENLQTITFNNIGCSDIREKYDYLSIKGGDMENYNNLIEKYYEDRNEVTNHIKNELDNEYKKLKFDISKDKMVQNINDQKIDEIHSIIEIGMSQSLTRPIRNNDNNKQVSPTLKLK